MTASYRLIDYTLRPAKSAERKMLAEAFARLKVFGSLRTYTYIGFGSIWYADCVLFHRSLGIEKLISIEREIDHERRFEFNLPYRGIELKMGDSATVLPTLDWRRRTIIWLDYEDPLSPAILDDIGTVATRACPGTALIVSVQAEKILDKRPHNFEPLVVTDREHFRDLFGNARTPQDLTKAKLRGWAISRFSRQVITKEIQARLTDANATRTPGQRMQFSQFAAFEYADDAKITTVGGVFFDEGQAAIFDSAGFSDLPFYRSREDALRIGVPLLTSKEMRFLDRSLPCGEDEEIEAGPMPVRDVRHYVANYRYLPNFAAFEP